MPSQREDPPFKPRDTIGLATKGTLIFGGAGLFISAVQNTLTKQNIGALGVITKTGGTITTCAAMGGSYMFFRNAAANLREREDVWNTVLGGFVAGGILGTRFRTMPAVIGYGAGLATFLGVFDYTGASLTGFIRDTDDGSDTDEVTRKQLLRSTHRLPFQDTIASIGEGRGIRSPGYEERRRERLTEKYGVDFSKVDQGTGGR